MADKISKKETDTFDDLTGGEFNNFLLSKHPSGHLVISADHSEEQDESKLEILYVRATPAVVKVLGLDVEPDDDEDDDDDREVHRDEGQKKWKGR